jgi:hypothetical protein
MNLRVESFFVCVSKLLECIHVVVVDDDDDADDADDVGCPVLSHSG